MLTDFGIARLLESNIRLAPPQGLIGSLKYLSSKTINGKEIDSRIDIRAFAILLYEIFMSLVSFQGDSLPALLMSTDLFVFDRDDEQTIHVSIRGDGSQMNGTSFKPEMSTNGRFIAIRYVPAEYSNVNCTEIPIIMEFLMNP